MPRTINPDKITQEYHVNLNGSPIRLPFLKGSLFTTLALAKGEPISESDFDRPATTNLQNLSCQLRDIFQEQAKAGHLILIASQVKIRPERKSGYALDITGIKYLRIDKLTSQNGRCVLEKILEDGDVSLRKPPIEIGVLKIQDNLVSYDGNILDLNPLPREFITKLALAGGKVVPTRHLPSASADSLAAVVRDVKRAFSKAGANDNLIIKAPTGFALNKPILEIK